MKIAVTKVMQSYEQSVQASVLRGKFIRQFKDGPILKAGLVAKNYTGKKINGID